MMQMQTENNSASNDKSSLPIFVSGSSISNTRDCNHAKNTTLVSSSSSSCSLSESEGEFFLTNLLSNNKNKINYGKEVPISSSESDYDEAEIHYQKTTENIHAHDDEQSLPKIIDYEKLYNELQHKARKDNDRANTLEIKCQFLENELIQSKHTISRLEREKASMNKENTDNQRRREKDKTSYSSTASIIKKHETEIHQMKQKHQKQLSIHKKALSLANAHEEELEKELEICKTEQLSLLQSQRVLKKKLKENESQYKEEITELKLDLEKIQDTEKNLRDKIQSQEMELNEFLNNNDKKKKNMKQQQAINDENQNNATLSPLLVQKMKQAFDDTVKGLSERVHKLEEVDNHKPIRKNNTSKGSNCDTTSSRRRCKFL